jgi:hypothetical protein
MRHTWILGALLLAGCSTHPVVDVMDFLHPGKMYRDEVTPYGGVCGPQGAVLGPGLGPCPPPSGPGVVPPPVPLPGTAGGSAPVPTFPTRP